MKIKFLSSIILFIVILSGFETAEYQTNLNLTAAQIKAASLKLDSLVYSKMGKNFPGFAVLVVKAGKKIYNKGFGFENLQSKQKITPNTNFYLASVSKEFTAMAIMILHDRGKLNFDDKIQKYLPSFPSYGKDVTIRELLTHTSGIPDYYSLLGYGHNFSGITNKDVWQLLLKQDSLNFQPGSKYEYSNSGYVLLSMIVERISRQPFAMFMKKNIFEKLRMNNTLVCTPNNYFKISNRATGYIKDSTGNYVKDDYNQFTTGAGGIFSNINDLYKWDQSLYTSKLVKKSTLQEAFTKQKLNNEKDIDYGFGWVIGSFEDGKLKGFKYLYHTGALDGFRNLIFRIPELHFSYIVLSNSGEDLANPETITKLFFN